MRRAEIATYVIARLSAAAALIVAIPARQWRTVVEIVLWLASMTALAYTLGRRHEAWAAATLIALLLFGLIVRTLNTGRPPFVLVMAVLLYLYIGAFRAARDYATLPGAPVEPDRRRQN